MSSIKGLQTRNFKLEQRDSNTDEMKISGYFVVFNSETKLFDNCYEEVSPAAFKDLDMSDVRALADHDSSKVLGRTKSGTLKLTVDDYGLFGEIEINPDDTEAVNLYQRVKRGDIDQCSFGFNILDEDIDVREDGSTKFTIKEIELAEISVVTFPAYQDTQVEARKKQVEQSQKRSLQIKKQQVKEKYNWL